MIKEIRYGGVTTSPSDYECKDGDLALVSNMLTEGTALSTSTPPAAVENFGSAMPVYIHQGRYITKNETDRTIRYQQNVIYQLDSDEELHNVTSMGNVLIILTSKGIKYIGFSDMTYKPHSGNLSIDLRFMLAAHKEFSTEGVPITVRGDRAGGLIPTDTVENWNAFVGQANRLIDNATKHNRFMAEFYVRYAVRLYDGSLVNISAPILMTPNTDVTPCMCIIPIQGNPEVHAFAYSCVLQAKNLTQILNADNDIFKSVVIAVTPPIFKYDQSREYERGAEDPMGMGGTLQNISIKQPEKENVPGYSLSSPPVTRPRTSGSQTVIPCYYKHTLWDLYTSEYGQHDPSKTNRIAVLPAVKNSEHIRNKSNISSFYIIKEYTIDELQGFSDSTFTIDMDSDCLVNLTSNEQLKDDASASLSSIVPRKAFVYNGRLNVADFLKNVFCGYNYALQQGYTQDEREKDTTTLDDAIYKKYVAKVSFVENGSTYTAIKAFHVNDLLDNFSEVRWFYFPHPNATSVTLYEYQYNSGTDNLMNTVRYDLKLSPHPFLSGSYWIGEEPSISRKYIELVQLASGQVGLTGEDTQFVQFDLPTGTGTTGKVFIYGNDTFKEGDEVTVAQRSPYGDEIETYTVKSDNSGKYVEFDSIHIDVNSVVAEWHSADDVTGDTLTLYKQNPSIEPTHTDYSPTISYPNQVRHSEVNNPFFFPSAGTSQIPAERVIALRPATMALSENQYGDNDLYVFTTDGVFAFKVAADGRFSNVKVVTRDVVNGDGESITQLDHSILFATQRGIMELAGQTTQCLSNDLDAAMQPVDSLVPSDWAGEKPSVPFGQFIGNCRMAYEYIGQRVIVFNPDKDYSYAYNIKSHKYTLIPYGFDSTVNSYPESLVVGKSGNDNVLYDLSTMQSLAPTYEWKNGNTSYYTRTPAPLSGTTYYTDRECTVVGGTITSVGASTIKVGNTDYTLCRYEGWILTRPVSLDSPNEYKILDYVRQNGVFDGFSIDGQQSDLGSLGAIDENLEEISGNFKSDAIQQVVYASNDLRHWKRIASSNSHRTNCMYDSGTAPTQFKWFRLAVRCSFVPGDALCSATFAFRTKFDNVKLL